MKDNKKSEWYQKFLTGINQKGQEILRWQAQKRFIMENYGRSLERAKLKAEIKSEIISELGFTADVQESIKNIKQLEKSLEEFFKHFK